MGLASSHIVFTQGKIGPHNSSSKSCFSAPREKRRILILSSDLPYDLVLLGQIIAACVHSRVAEEAAFLESLKDLHLNDDK